MSKVAVASARFVSGAAVAIPAFAVGQYLSPSADVSTTGWVYNDVSGAASIGEATRDDATYIQAAFGAPPYVADLDGSLSAGSVTVNIVSDYIAASASSGQFRLSLLNGSNVSQGVSAWQAVTSSAAQYDVPITTTGTATRIKIEIQA